MIPKKIVFVMDVKRGLIVGVDGGETAFRYE
jgi:hypothetical protein